MPNSKISALPSATTPLAGTETLPIVQSSTTRQVSVANLTAGRAISASGVTVTGLTASRPVFTDGSSSLTSSGTVPTNQGGTGLTSFTANGVVYASSTSALATGATLVYDGTNFMVGTNTPTASVGLNATIYNNTSTGTVSDNAAVVVQSVNRNATVTLRGVATATNALTFADQTTIASGIAGDIANKALFFRSNGATEQARITSAGNFGLGTAAPGKKLELNGVGSNAAIRMKETGTYGVNWDVDVGSANAMRFNNNAGSPLSYEFLNGDVLVTGIANLGYGTGSGGAVTQITSRTTGVTLDRSNGAITLVSAAGTTAWQSFTVTNNKVVATDTVIVNQKSGTDLYQIFVTNVAAGSFRITFATTGGTTTEQPVFNFAVIKAVTS